MRRQDEARTVMLGFATQEVKMHMLVKRESRRLINDDRE